MTVVRGMFFGSVVFLVFMAGGFIASAVEIEKVEELIGKLKQKDFQNVIDALVQIEVAFLGRLDKVLTQHFTRESIN